MQVNVFEVVSRLCTDDRITLLHLTVCTKHKLSNVEKHIERKNNRLDTCKDAYASIRRYMDMVANMNSSDYIYRRVDVKVRLSLEI